MLKRSLELLKKLESSGFKAYIVGGFVRDCLIKRQSSDVDICTNAKPKDLLNVFPDAILPKEKYGSVTLLYKGIRFEITTFRKEIRYENRKPIEIEYTDDFEEDIRRRDFTVNTLCMNSDGDLIDILNGKEDIKNRVIKVVGDVNKKFEEDPLRMLRAVRFATKLNFKLDESVIAGIKNNAKYILNLSYDRKKDELIKILVCNNADYGIKMIIDLCLDKYLELSNLNKMIITGDILGMLSQLNIVNIYPFSNNEKECINNINNIVNKKSIDNVDLYNYGLYVCQIAADILNINRKILIRAEKKLPIRSKRDICISADEICNLLNIRPNGVLKEVYKSLEKEILCGNILNKKEDLKKYILNNY